MGVDVEEFLRRYATSPIHVPRLERLLATYGPEGDGDPGDPGAPATGTWDAFARAYVGWDRACGDADAARIVTEIISQLTDTHGRLIRLTDATVRGAIVWIAESKDPERRERVAALSTILSELPHPTAAPR